MPDDDKSLTDAARVVADLAKLKVRADAQDAEIAKLKATNEKLEGENAGLKSKADKADKADKATEDAAARERFDTAVEQRVALIGEARKHLGADWKADGKDALTIQREVVAKLSPTVKLDGPDGKPRSADFVAGVYAVAIESATRVDANQDAFAVLGAPHLDAKGKPKAAAEDDEEEVEDAADKMVSDMKNNWKPKGDRAAAGGH
jgi:hypothetical protein